MKYFGSQIRPYDEETNDSDRNALEKKKEKKGPPLYAIGYSKGVTSLNGKGLLYVYKQYLPLQMNI